MNGCCLVFSLVQDNLGMFDFRRRPVDNQEEFAVLHLGLVLQDAVLRNTDAL